MQYKTYTVRAYPNKSQQKLIYLTFLMCKIMFNTLFSIVLNNYKEFVLNVTSNIDFDEKEFANSHKLPRISKLKKVNNNYKLVDSLALCAEYSNLVRGMEMFYRGHSKMPKFKGRNDKHSYTTSQVNNNIRIAGNKIRLPKLGFIKVRGLRKAPNNCTIKRAIVFENKTGKFFISLIFEFEDNNTNINLSRINSKKVVGLDFKIGDIFVSNNNFIPKYSNS